MKNLQMYIFHICRFNKGEDKYFFYLLYYHRRGIQ